MTGGQLNLGLFKKFAGSLQPRRWATVAHSISALMTLLVLLSLGQAAHAAPANDNFANATVVTPTYVYEFGSNVAATKESGEPNHAGNVGGASVWYSWTAPANEQVSFSLVGNNFTGLVGVYTGSSVNALTPVASAQGSAAATFTATLNTTYYVAVDGFNSGSGAAQGSFALTANQIVRPANDNFANATVISGTGSGSASGSNTNATKESGEPNHAGNVGGASVWHAWSTPTPGTYGFYVNSSFSSLLGVYTGSSVSALTPVAGAHNGHVAQFDAAANTTYYIAVDGVNSGSGAAQGSFTLYWNSPPSGPTPPVNDNFANAQMISATNYGGSANGSNVGATKETGEPNHAGNVGGASVWYTWTAPSSGSFSFSAANMLLAIYTGSSVSALTPVASSSNGAVTFSATGGTTYYIAVDGVNANDGYGAQEQQFTLNVSYNPPPANDNFANATVISATGYGSNPYGYNLQATKEAGEPNHAGNAGGASVWYSWTAPTSGRYKIYLTNANFNSLLAVYTGNSVNALTPVASAQSGPVSGNQTGNAAVFDAVANTPYHIAVDGVNDGNTVGEGSFVLNSAPTGSGPANDNFANAQSINGSSGTVSGSNVAATKESGEPNHAGNPGGASIWYVWTAPASGTATFTTAGSNFDTLLAVYTGSAVNALTPVTSNNDVAANDTTSSVTFAATAGTTYRIALDGAGAGAGNTALNWGLVVPQPTSLTLSIAPTTFSETAGANAATGTVTLDRAPTADLVVNLASSNPNAATVPASVAIAANSTTAAFAIGAVDNTIADGAKTVTISATAGALTDSKAVTVTDNETPQLFLSISPGPLTEGGALTATIARNTPTDQALTVNVSSDSGLVTLPATVTIPAGQAATNFTLSQPDDNIAYGPSNATITVSKDGFAPVTGTVGLTDNDTPALTLVLSAANVVEGGGVTGTVTRNTPPTGDLAVTLSSSNATIPVPAGVTIPAGQLAASFTISTTDDAVAQGNRSTTLTATAGGLTASQPFTVVDNDGAPTLTLSISPTTFGEDESATGTITRNTPVDSDMAVSLSSSDPSVASVPPSVTIPAGSSTVNFTVGGVSDHTADDARGATISASGSGLTAAPVAVTVTNTDVAPPVPTISNVAPASAPVGTVVTISGVDLDAATVKFGTFLAQVNAAASSATKLVVTVPNDVAVGNTTITVTNADGKATHAFTVTKLIHFSVSGTVKTKTGAAVPGAKVALLPLAGTGTPTAAAIQDAVLDFLTAPATTRPLATVVDSKGNYAFSGLAAGNYLVVPDKAGTAFKDATTSLAYQVVQLATKNAPDVNFVEGTTETTKPAISVAQPTNNATFVAAKVPAAKGTVADSSGILAVGVALARINTTSATALNLSLFNWTTNRFDGALTVPIASNLFAKVTPGEIKAATVTGNIWTSALPLNLTPGNYRVIPFAVDKNFNIGYPLPTGTTLLTGNFKVGPAPHSVGDAPAGVALSTATAQVATSSIGLRFLAALDADAAGDASHYTVTINGRAVPVESAGYNATTHSVTLGLPDGSLKAGDAVVVQWNLLDGKGDAVAGQSGSLTARK